MLYHALCILFHFRQTTTVQVAMKRLPIKEINRMRRDHYLKSWEELLTFIFTYWRLSCCIGCGNSPCLLCGGNVFERLRPVSLPEVTGTGRIILTTSRTYVFTYCFCYSTPFCIIVRSLGPVVILRCVHTCESL